ncbi:MAG: nucleotidyltransferase domain-containing protein [Parcubacteria group bacterium]|jgi:predicted nucleotidyltransferase
MLNLFFKSKTRQGIAKLLFSNEDKKFYLSEIARIVAASPGTAQRELEKMLKTGIIKSEMVASRRYYFANKQDPIFFDVQNIVRKTIGIEAGLESVVKKISNIEFAFIFGSYAKGDFGGNSDVDLFIIGNPDEDELIAKISKIEKEIDREINYHIWGVAEFLKKIKKDSFLQNVTKKYILLTKNKNEFRKLLQ